MQWPGADRAVNPKAEDLSDVVQGATSGLEADAVILAISIPAPAEQALTLMLLP